MEFLNGLTPVKVFEYFEKICSIPHGSGNTKQISEFCLEFAKQHSLKATRDSADNVIIFKDGTVGYENAEPVILQGHIDMVCQKEEGCEIDFDNQGITPYVDEDFIKAKGTTLGADNGIAVAMIMAILDSSDIPHPPIEAVFTSDEEVGMLGAMALSCGELKGKKMINIDSEDPGVVTVSCAGGVDCHIALQISKKIISGKKVTLELCGLKSGHSGVEINSGRVNANILMGRVLNEMNSLCSFDIVSINGGDKTNVITGSCTAEIVVEDELTFIYKANEILLKIKNEIDSREPDFIYIVGVEEEGEFQVIDHISKEKLLFLLLIAPNGVMEMSMEINGLVESSLNLGVVSVEEGNVRLLFSCRSNKRSALKYLSDKLKGLGAYLNCSFEEKGHYPPWEYNDNSQLQALYKDVYKERFGYEPKVEAIHAGLECGVFASKIDGLDCISIGPEMYDIHTVNERLSIKSTRDIYELLLELLKRLR